ncbi:sterol desaturase family protein [Sphingomonas sp. DC1600-2]
MTMVWDGIGWLAGYWANQLGGTFFGTGSTLSIFGLMVTVLIAAFLAVPRGRRAMPRLAVWRRALFPRRIFSSASGRADLWWFAFSLFGYGLLFGWAVLSSVQIAALLRGMIGPVAPLGLPPIVAGAVLTLLLYLAYEFAYWLDHYLSHAVPLLWQFHAVHHSAESLSLLTTFRVHPVDTIVFANITAIMIGVTQGLAGPLLGEPHGVTISGVNALTMIGAIALTHLQHSHLWVTFGPRWGRWLLSPAHHQIHHSIDARHHNRNFGNTLALFDRLFGTLHLPAARREPLRFGVEGGGTRPHGWRTALFAPFGKAWALRPRTLRPLAQPDPPRANAGHGHRYRQQG